MRWPLPSRWDKKAFFPKTQSDRYGNRELGQVQQPGTQRGHIVTERSDRITRPNPVTPFAFGELRSRLLFLVPNLGTKYISARRHVNPSYQSQAAAKVRERRLFVAIVRAMH
ncbi:MAG: hypothetical protein FWH27_00260 [Planctomycetaceae bacterium]|nr:hypothetical protein [Planctomycetaceae bacterium]